MILDTTFLIDLQRELRKGVDGPASKYLAASSDELVRITFVSWMTLGIPAVLMMLPLGWLVLLRVFPPEIEHLPIRPEDIDAQLEALGPPRPVEVKTLAVFALTIALWLTSPLLASLTGGVVSPWYRSMPASVRAR